LIFDVRRAVVREVPQPNRESRIANPESLIPSTIVLESGEISSLQPARREPAADRARAGPCRATRCACCITKQPGRHLLIAARQFAILGLTTWALIAIGNPLVRIPLALVQGSPSSNFTVLLHEVVHHTIFTRRRPAAERAARLLYAVPSRISASQFTRWHLDHHAELGSIEDIRSVTTCRRRNARWFKKLLYCSPALFPITFARRGRRARLIDGAERRIGVRAASRSSRISRRSA